MSTNQEAPKTVTYTGGSDGVVISFNSGHRIEFLKGNKVEICAEDAKELEGNDDFKPASKQATDPTPKPTTSKEDK